MCIPNNCKRKYPFYRLNQLSFVHNVLSRIMRMREYKTLGTNVLTAKNYNIEIDVLQSLNRIYPLQSNFNKLKKIYS